MKKLTILVSEQAREDFLSKLRRLGTVHIENLSKPSSGEIASIEDSTLKADHAASLLKDYKVHIEAEKIKWKPSEIPKHVEEIIALAKDREKTQRFIQDIEYKMEWFEPWGAFDPGDLYGLKKKGIAVTLYRASKKEAKQIIKEKDSVHLINEKNGYAYLSLITDNPDEKLLLEEIKPPEESLEELYKHHEASHMRIEQIDEALRAEARGEDSLKGHLSVSEGRLRFLNVMHGMREEKNFACLSGYCPKNRVKDIIAISKAEGVGYLIEEPEDPEKTPTLIRNPAWIRIINPVFKFMNILPGYKEFDISLWLLLFFSLFFAMLVGDAGYGLIFLLLTVVAQIKIKKAPREVIFLMYILSLATIGWGAITGTWFGVKKILEIPFFNSLVINDVNSYIDSNQSFMIYLCFIIGVVHLTLARLIRAFKVINSVKALAEIGWILILWGLFFAAGMFVINKPFPPYAGYLFILGAALIILFGNPQKNIIKGMFISLANIPLKAVNCFSDIVSYIRLFAVGYASVVLSTTFNDLVLNLGFGNFLAGFISAMILFFG
ncbi:MAG: hypothetical protein HQ579_01330, partial [Candidatus Omnitrophica bacterium]|nr:hypothetical protein [Candidatus Omnitrophota bacterium]